jgi:iodotyrosine deiodinase
MRTRRSVRQFAPDPVRRELVANALRVAGSAPSGANQQPWTFVVVYDDATKQRIREAAEHEEQLLYRERATAEYLAAIEPIGTTAIKPHLTDAPCVIAVFEQRPFLLVATGYPAADAEVPALPKKHLDEFAVTIG